MKRFFALMMALIMLLCLCACNKEPVEDVAVLTEEPVMAEPLVTAEPTPSPEPTPEPTPVPIQPTLPPVNDTALNAILDDMLERVQPGSAGSSLRAAQCAAALLDWGTTTQLTDDEIYSAVGCWLDMQDDDRLLLFFDCFYSVYTQSYNLRGENAEGLMRDAGISSGNYPWDDKSAHAVEMLYYGSGLR